MYASNTTPPPGSINKTISGITSELTSELIVTENLLDRLSRLIHGGLLPERTMAADALSSKKELPPKDCLSAELYGLLLRLGANNGELNNLICTLENELDAPF